jgi:hypothetical protein
MIPRRSWYLTALAFDMAIENIALYLSQETLDESSEPV